MTYFRSQKRKSCIKTTQGVPLIQRLDFKRAGDQADRGNSKKLDHKKKNTLVITKVPTRPEDWTLKTQAGCKFWVHNRTGEASTTCPYDSNQSSFPIPQSRSMTPIHRSLFAPTPSPTKSESPSSSPQCSSPQQLPSDEMGIMLEPDDEPRFRSSTFQSPRLFDGDEETNVGTGLGALIYDTSEYQDLLRALDASLSLSPSKGTTNSNIRSSL